MAKRAVPRSVGRKRGRKPAHYRTSWGEVINGLGRRRSDGLWRVIGTKITFSEPDERMAIARFRSFEKQDRERLPMSFREPAELMQALDNGAVVSVQTREAVEVQGRRTYHGGKISVFQEVDAPLLWTWMRQVILERPQLAAERSGIEQLAWLADLQKPKASPSLDAVGKLYFEKAKIGRQERRESLGFWKEFRKAMAAAGSKTLRELTAAAVADYGDAVTNRGKSPTYVRHRFGKVKTIINFARKRGLLPDDCRHALDCCAVLVPPRKRPTNAKPVSPADFSRLLAAADDRTAAAMLLGLNLCLAPKEICAVRWDELDLDKGTFVSAREKTGVIRIGMLWERTVEALAKLPRKSEAVISSSHGTALSIWTLRDNWHALRASVGLPSVELASLKDGAYTAAVEAGIPIDQVKLLAGHQLGISDHYIRRAPWMVRDACEAIRAHYQQ